VLHLDLRLKLWLRITLPLSARFADFGKFSVFLRFLRRNVFLLGVVARLRPVSKVAQVVWQLIEILILPCRNGWDVAA
jgi:hypothetical protein